MVAGTSMPASSSMGLVSGTSLPASSSMGLASAMPSRSSSSEVEVMAAAPRSSSSKAMGSSATAPRSSSSKAMGSSDVMDVEVLEVSSDDGEPELLWVDPIAKLGYVKGRHSKVSFPLEPLEGSKFAVLRVHGHVVHIKCPVQLLQPIDRAVAEKEAKKKRLKIDKKKPASLRKPAAVVEAIPSQVLGQIFKVCSMVLAETIPSLFETHIVVLDVYSTSEVIICVLWLLHFRRSC